MEKEEILAQMSERSTEKLEIVKKFKDKKKPTDAHAEDNWEIYRQTDRQTQNEES